MPPSVAIPSEGSSDGPMFVPLNELRTQWQTDILPPLTPYRANVSCHKLGEFFSYDLFHPLPFNYCRPPLPMTHIPRPLSLIQVISLLNPVPSHANSANTVSRSFVACHSQNDICAHTSCQAFPTLTLIPLSTAAHTHNNPLPLSRTPNLR